MRLSADTHVKTENEKVFVCSTFTRKKEEEKNVEMIMMMMGSEQTEQIFGSCCTKKDQ